MLPEARDIAVRSLCLPFVSSAVLSGREDETTVRALDFRQECSVCHGAGVPNAFRPVRSDRELT
jgi:hypothetical protein